ncbi:MAG: hypothetical protein QM728_11485 [Gordonia sp. (in: high G+C Gram-positive bacteria)]|uniref:hypothetical protein n=1 Tax=Gordonia sp. (in: high G+C Gram-positive bacteria) TaxID=84139 RepID=UPI0039E5A00B
MINPAKRLLTVALAVPLAAGIAGAGAASAIPDVPGAPCVHCPPQGGQYQLLNRVTIDVIGSHGLAPTVQLFAGGGPFPQVVAQARAQQVPGSSIFRTQFTGRLKKGVGYSVAARNAWYSGQRNFSYNGKPVRLRVSMHRAGPGY